jgi:hypothetical protein
MGNSLLICHITEIDSNATVLLPTTGKPRTSGLTKRKGFFFDPSQNEIQQRGRW